MRILEIKKYDAVNGPGIRTSIWIAGCVHKCPGCWSAHTWNPKQGELLTTVIDDIMKCVNSDNVSGISILGGDPFMEFMEKGDTEIFELISTLHTSKKPIWIWTGYKFEELISKISNSSENINKLKLIDVIIDGKFEAQKRDLNLYYRGSSNQRIIDVKKSLQTNNIIELSV